MLGTFTIISFLPKISRDSAISSVVRMRSASSVRLFVVDTCKLSTWVSVFSPVRKNRFFMLRKYFEDQVCLISFFQLHKHFLSFVSESQEIRDIYQCVFN